MSEGYAFEFTKAAPEMRYTFGPLYAPNRKDAHGEYTDADVLHKAVIEYVRESASKGRRINLQHGDLGDVTLGEWVELASWPYDHTIKVRVPGGREREIEMPAGTIYMGVIWDPEVWPMVKSGQLRGYSLGGRAVRVGTPGVDLEAMGDARKATEVEENGQRIAEQIEQLRKRAARTHEIENAIAWARLEKVLKDATRHHSQSQMRDAQGKWRQSMARRTLPSANTQLVSKADFEFFGR